MTPPTAPADGGRSEQKRTPQDDLANWLLEKSKEESHQSSLMFTPGGKLFHQKQARRYESAAQAVNDHARLLAEVAELRGALEAQRGRLRQLSDSDRSQDAVRSFLVVSYAELSSAIANRRKTP